MCEDVMSDMIIYNDEMCGDMVEEKEIVII